MRRHHHRPTAAEATSAPRQGTSSPRFGSAAGCPRAATRAACMEPSGAHVSVCLGVAHANARAVVLFLRPSSRWSHGDESGIAYKLLVHMTRESECDHEGTRRRGNNGQGTSPSPPPPSSSENNGVADTETWSRSGNTPPACPFPRSRNQHGQVQPNGYPKTKLVRSSIQWR